MWNQGTVVVDSPIACLLTANQGGKIYNLSIPNADLRVYRGQWWAWGTAVAAAVNTILPPNSPACLAIARLNSTGDPGQFPATSRHPGGVQVLMADGSVRFVSENIDTGDLSALDPRTLSGRSPYGVWGSLGSIQGGETIAEF